MNLTAVVAAHRSGSGEADRLEESLVVGLAQLGLDVLVVPYLYDVTAMGPVAGRLRSLQGNLVVLTWLYPRATAWVLDALGVAGRLGRTSSWPAVESLDDPRADQPDRTIWCFDLRTQPEPAPYLTEIAGLLPGTSDTTKQPGTVKRLETSRPARWYPVIDRSRCANCLECLNFCLFGVYGLDASGHVFVEQPDACRNGCPACSRVCPQRAIIFPEYQDIAIAGGPESLAEEKSENVSKTSPTPSPTHPAPSSVRDADRLVDDVENLEL